MLTTNLRKVGGSVMLTVPPALLEQLSLAAGSAVSLAVEDGRLIVDPAPPVRYTLEDLLAASDYAIPMSQEERAWLDAPTVGREIL
ncbi:AbrB/MazE/SpoVT family DNA-binding domain-containing protein [Elstera cyanobacteriorum]|uniref:AbrB/MazE/SpoVT family DNA-binding domain-containing protein n=1 Tax=Elstera cyanobacteriorum TaxID=2022747 RepID=UPI0023544686|nr:AbrB/MazE/SpoVT family DNA-binding domain-containing protein [Elstera cyanobacteriorum]MCK6442996.1 AbrB/MazE/SpoVT family DNA-binding domain-containing protein [Elstera cyanobacteriorum]